MMQESQIGIFDYPASLRGTFCPPGDKSVSLRAILFAAIATGRSQIQHISGGHDTTVMIRALAKIGLEITTDGVNAFVVGNPSAFDYFEMNLESSPTSLRLVAGAVGYQRGFGRLDIDPQLRRSVNARALEDAMGQLGVVVDAATGNPPVGFDARGSRGAKSVVLSSPSAQLKTAVLLSALSVGEPVTVTELWATRNHTEKMLGRFGASVATPDSRTTIAYPSRLQATDFSVPSDSSHAAYMIALAILNTGSRIEVTGLDLDSGRTGWLNVLLRMNANIDTNMADGTVVAEFSNNLQSTVIEEEEVSQLLDEIPVLAVIAARCTGTTVFKKVGSTRKQGNRLSETRQLLSQLGVTSSLESDGTLTVEGGDFTCPELLTPAGDHHVVGAAVIAAFCSKTVVGVSRMEVLLAAYPEFDSDLKSLLEPTSAPTVLANVKI